MISWVEFLKTKYQLTKLSTFTVQLQWYRIRRDWFSCRKFCDSVSEKMPNLYKVPRSFLKCSINIVQLMFNLCYNVLLLSCIKLTMTHSFTSRLEIYYNLHFIESTNSTCRCKFWLPLYPDHLNQYDLKILLQCSDLITYYNVNIT